MPGSSSRNPSLPSRPIPRIAADAARSRLAGFPILTITGPRQSGKTTLSRLLAPERPYFSLEDPDTRALATEDPRAFLRQVSDGAILDEVQRVPELFSYRPLLERPLAPPRHPRPTLKGGRMKTVPAFQWTTARTQLAI